MAFEVCMPQLGLTMEEGTVSQWIKHEGDAVKTGDVLLEITTDKLTNEVTSEHDGVLLKIVAQEGEDVPVKVRLFACEYSLRRWRVVSASCLPPSLFSVSTHDYHKHS